MPLPTPAARRGIHRRTIDMQAYVRDDGLYDVEAHLVDIKPFLFESLGRPAPVPPGQPLHDLWVRLTVDGNYAVRDIRAASDVTPYAVCKEAETTLQVLVGERLVRGWSATVKQHLRGAASCTHLMEVLIPLATTALQGIRGLRPASERKRSGGGAPAQLDSCYAYSREREIVLRFWPEHYRAPGVPGVSGSGGEAA
ncbi:DUF2889 domain-containing protein [Xylophilus sp. GW821-FHT01B05]